MTFEEMQARKAAFAHLDNVALVAAFLADPCSDPRFAFNDGDAICSLLADREEAGEDPASDYDRAQQEARRGL